MQLFEKTHVGLAEADLVHPRSERGNLRPLPYVCLFEELNGSPEMTP